MKKTIIFLFLISLLVLEIHNEMMEEERKYLYNKVIKRINILDTFTPLKNIYFRNANQTIQYNPNKIKQILDKYKFPEQYNFIEQEKPDVHIKDQERCSSCWAFASTTALSYRFHKKGIKVDLSPQYPISCYLRKCDTGDYLIDSQFNLVKNGTVTEECLPYSSGRGLIEECPIKCKNGSALEKYYSTNAYSNSYTDIKEQYYDVVTVIIDQLINYGPLVAGIDCYEDFQKFGNINNCANRIYRYDGVSKNVGGHAVVIVGYGYEDSKYYWIAQNSWGESYCNGGFVKIEFGQINIERIGFSEPYIAGNEEKKDISVKLNLKEDCTLKYTSNSNIANDNSFELYFTGESNDKFYYQCGIDYGENKDSICTYSNYYFKNNKGYYTYTDYQPLKTKNTFNIDFSSMPEKKFYYYGMDYIDALYGENYFYSEDKTFILLILQYYNEDDNSLVSKIYPNINTKTPLSDCSLFDVNGRDNYDVILCKVKGDELRHFEGTNQKLPLTYDVLCGTQEITSTVVQKLDTTKYPVFRIKTIILPSEDYIGMDSRFALMASIEGNVSEYKNGDYFGAFVQVFYNNKSSIEYLSCETGIPVQTFNDYEMRCIFMNKKYYPYFDEVILLPYTYPKNESEKADPYEVIIENNIKAIEYEEYREIKSFAKSQFNKLDYILILGLLLLI
jgi:cathepsin B